MSEGAVRSYFNKIFGNDALKKRIGAAVDSSKIPHALLIVGDEGTGKLTMAKEIAAALNCENRGSTSHPLPCNSCNTCRRIAENNFLDVKIISKPQERATFGIEEIRGMISDMMLTATESDYKVYIFKDSHLMTTQAQNALLKILEEPPEGGMMILIANEADKILTTIKSRVQTVAMQRFDAVSLDAYLGEHSKEARAMKMQNRDGYFTALSSADGSIGKALSLMNPESVAECKEKAERITSIISLFEKKTSYIDVKSKILSLPNARAELSQVLEDLVAAIGELIVAKYDPEAQRKYYPSKDDAYRISRKIGAKRLSTLYDAVIKLKDDCQRNANVATLLSSFAAKIAVM